MERTGQDNKPREESESNPLVVEMRGIVKRFPGLTANDHVDFDVRRGEIHALLGENGAGKSTLMNVLAGLYKPEAGTIKIKGKTASFGSPRDAISAGIGMIHQHFMLVPSQTVTENILLGLDKPRFHLNLREYDRIVAEMGERFGLSVDPRARVWQLSVGEQQRIEILKMLYRGADILVMDEPTAVLAPQEIEELFRTLRAMVAEGKSIIFISHKLQEVMAIADRVTVLRKGKVTAAGLDAHQITRQELAKQMVGREVIFHLDKQVKEPGQVVLSVRDVCAENDKGLKALKGLSLDVRAGEIVGLAGVAGNGQRELAQIVTGMRRCASGEVLLNGENISNHSALFGILRGVAHVPEDRTHVGTAPNLSMTDNIIMKQYRNAPLDNHGFLNMGLATRMATRLKEEYDIMVPTVETPVRLLSGGNLQRVILAREISGHPTLLVAVQPTRGLDVGAIEGVHRLLLGQREQDAAILLISEELEELISLSDRVFVIYEGRIMGELEIRSSEPSGDLIDSIGQMMTGTPLTQVQHGEGVPHG